MDMSQLRSIPKVDNILEWPEIKRVCREVPRALARETIRRELDRLRGALRQGELETVPSAEELDAMLCAEIKKAAQPSLRRVINATGVVLHTNLGRAPLGTEIAASAAFAAAGYSNLEYNLEKGCRGSRYACTEELLCALTGAEAALIVNNNAAAVFLMLNTLAQGKKAAVSRGELVEIGGGFRIPEIMALSGAELMETGTTNKTRLSDYKSAIDLGAEVLLKVHTSNFKITGFTEETALSQLSALAKESGTYLLYDMGSGFLIRPETLGLHEGAYIPDAVRECDVVCFSGDKLLGGAQAGILLGKSEPIALMKKNQLNRMLRPDKLTLAALEAVLRCYIDEKQAKEKIPALRMLAAEQTSLLETARLLAARLADCCPTLHFFAEPCADETGGGSLPGMELSGAAVAVEGAPPQVLEEKMRANDPPVIGRISRNRFLLSVRTLMPGDVEKIADVFSKWGAGL